jgi:hypothetical protein
MTLGVIGKEGRDGVVDNHTDACDEETHPLAHQPGTPIRVSLPVTRNYLYWSYAVDFVAVVVV